MTMFEGILLYHTLPCLVTMLIAIQILRLRKEITRWTSDEWGAVLLAGILYPIAMLVALGVSSVAIASALSQTEIPWTFWTWRKR